MIPMKRLFPGPRVVAISLCRPDRRAFGSKGGKYMKKKKPVTVSFKPGLILPTVDRGVLVQGDTSKEDDDPFFSYAHANELFDPSLHLATAPRDWTGYEAATPLSDALSAYIGVTGRPMSTAAFMQAALTHPEYGYYTRGVRTSDEDDFADESSYDMEGTTATSTSTADDKKKEKDPSYVIGPSGDFVTAPEVSQIFGESLAVWFAATMAATSDSSSDKARDFQWLECGPGKGTLMADLVKFTLQIPTMAESLCKIHLVETSSVLRQLQRETLKELHPWVDLRFVDEDLETTDKSTNDIPTSSAADVSSASEKKLSVSVHWHNSLADFMRWQQKEQQAGTVLGEDGAAISAPLLTYCVCQEFLDALPVYSFEKSDTGAWRERMVDVAVADDMLDDEDRNQQESSMVGDVKSRLRLVLAPEATPALQTLLGADAEGFLPDDGDAPVGTIVEVCPEALIFCQDLARILAQSGGAALLIDYGQDGGTHDSLRGFSQHEQVSFLSKPGNVDVTANVDFGACRQAVNAGQGEQVRAWGPVEQGTFLVRMGVSDRVVSLLERDDVSDQQADDLVEAMMRLVAPEEMGSQYKVLALTTLGTVDSDQDPPPGFEEKEPAMESLGVRS